MKLKKIVFVGLILALFIACFPTQAFAFGLEQTTNTTALYGSRYSTNSQDWFDDWDVVEQEEYIMPDLHNTGYVSDYEDLVDFGTKYPNITKKTTTYSGVTITTYTITDANAAEYNYCFEGFKATNACFQFYNGGESVAATKDIVMRDFCVTSGDSVSSLFATRRIYTQARLILLDGEMEGSTSSQVTGFNITVKRCYMHGAYADHVKGFSGQLFEGNYMCDGGHNGGNPHPDCVQFTCDNGHGQGLDTIYVRYFGNRMDAFCTYSNTMNSCIILQGEFGGGVKDVKINHNWFNGGGVSVEIGSKGNQVLYEDVEFVGNIFGRGECYQDTNYKFTNPASIVNQNTTVVTNTSIVKNVDVGSVRYFSGSDLVFSTNAMTDSSKKVIVSASNYSTSTHDIVVQVLLVSSTGEILNSKTEDYAFSQYLNYTSVRVASNWKTFKQSDQPIDKDIEVDISSFGSIPSGANIVTQVWKKVSTTGAQLLRSDALIPTGASTRNTFVNFAPESRLIVDTSLTSNEVKFMNIINQNLDSSGDKLVNAIQQAYPYYSSVNENVYGVIEAKANFVNLVNKCNLYLASANDFSVATRELSYELVPAGWVFVTSTVALFGCGIVFFRKWDV